MFSAARLLRFVAIPIWLALCCPLSSQVNTTFSFEDNMEGWESDVAMPLITCHVTSDLYPECPLQPSAIVDALAAVRKSGDRALDGNRSLKFTIDGREAEGAAWIIRPFPVTPGTRYRVSLQYYWTGSGANPIVYVGATRPKGMPVDPGPPTSDFLPLTLGCPVAAAGWIECDYLTEATADATGTIWTALGIWETNESVATSYIDKVTVTIDPIGDQATIAVLGMTPVAVSGQPRNPVFTFVFSDTKGWQDLGVVNVLINDTLNPAKRLLPGLCPG